MTSEEADHIGSALETVQGLLIHEWHVAEPRAFRNAAFTHIIISLHEALQALSRDGHRVDFNDHIPGDDDITDLISRLRGAVCHLRSGHRRLGRGWLTYNVICGYAPNAIGIDDVAIGCDFADDAAICFGDDRIYLRRHIHRAFTEAVTALQANRPPGRF